MSNPTNTNTDTSTSIPRAPHATQTTTISGKPIVYKDTVDVYDAWADTYDTDGNVLQRLDDEFFERTVRPFLRSLPESEGGDGDGWHVLDLGCGTGRNLVKVMGMTDGDGGRGSFSKVSAMDVSRSMMQKAEARLSEAERRKVSWVLYNLHHYPAVPMPSPVASSVDIIISTLVLEHIFLDKFFLGVKAALGSAQTRREGRDGYLILSNMHSEMGNLSSAGFVDPSTGAKVRPKDVYVYTPQQVVDAAREIAGLELVGPVEEVSVEEGDVERLGERSRKWVGVKMLFGMVFRLPVQRGGKEE